MKTPLFISSLLLIIAIAPMPYGYYQFLRIVIIIVAGITASKLYEKKQNDWLIVFLGIIIVYNPILVIHLKKTIWVPINVITAVIFGVFAFTTQKRH